MLLKGCGEGTQLFILLSSAFLNLAAESVKHDALLLRQLRQLRHRCQLFGVGLKLVLRWVNTCHVEGQEALAECSRGQVCAKMAIQLNPLDGCIDKCFGANLARC